MSQKILFGADASVALPSGMGCKLASASMNITQGIARAAGFGDGWMTKRGTGCKEASGVVAGFLTEGTSNDVVGIANIIREGAALTLTFFTGCTLAGSAIFSGFGVSTDFLANSNSSYSYEIDGAVTETWATS